MYLHILKQMKEAIRLRSTSSLSMLQKRGMMIDFQFLILNIAFCMAKLLNDKKNKLPQNGNIFCEVVPQMRRVFV